MIAGSHAGYDNSPNAQKLKPLPVGTGYVGIDFEAIESNEELETSVFYTDKPSQNLLGQRRSGRGQRSELLASIPRWGLHSPQE